MEPEKPDEGTEGGGAAKRRVTQSIVSLRDSKRKKNIEKQEQRWFALAGKKSTTSASLGAPPEAMKTTTETAVASSLGAEGMAPTVVTSTTEGDNAEAVFETVVDPQCVAWRRAQHGTKTGNSKEILQVEEKRWKVERSIEEREISPDEQMQTFADTMTVKSKTE